MSIQFWTHKGMDSPPRVVGERTLSQTLLSVGFCLKTDLQYIHRALPQPLGWLHCLFCVWAKCESAFVSTQDLACVLNFSRAQKGVFVLPQPHKITEGGWWKGFFSPSLLEGVKLFWSQVPLLPPACQHHACVPLSGPSVLDRKKFCLAVSYIPWIKPRQQLLYYML